MEKNKSFNESLKPKITEKKQIIRNKDIFNYKKDKNISSKQKNKVVTVLKQKKTKY
jgi:hypothetical protein